MSSPFSWRGEGGQVVDSTRRGDEVGRLAELTSIGLNLPLGLRLRSRVAIWPCSFTSIEEKNTPKSEQLRQVLWIGGKATTWLVRRCTAYHYPGSEGLSLSALRTTSPHLQLISFLIIHIERLLGRLSARGVGGLKVSGFVAGGQLA